jgi:hypothetical protein
MGAAENKRISEKKDFKRAGWDEKEDWIRCITLFNNLGLC